MIETIFYKGNEYLKLQSEGFAAQYIFPFAQKFCKGVGVDVGCKKVEWALPGSTPVDIAFNDGFSATNLPIESCDFIFSSHCLEHLENWVDVLDYWWTRVKVGGVIFLYLPHYDQEYWRPWNNRSHKVILTAEILTDYFKDKGCAKVFRTGRDLNHSFTVLVEK